MTILEFCKMTIFGITFRVFSKENLQFADFSEEKRHSNNSSGTNWMELVKRDYFSPKYEKQIDRFRFWTSPPRNKTWGEGKSGDE